MNSAGSTAFPTEELKNFGLEVAKSKFITLSSSDQAFELVQNFLGQLDTVQHLGFSRENKTSKLKANFGIHRFSFEERALITLIQSHGVPVGTNCGPALYTTMTIFESNGDAIFIQKFLDYLIDLHEAQSPDKIKVYSFHTQYHYWASSGKKNKRPLSTVILPPTIHKKVVRDIEQFTATEAKEWYLQHGIPYKRNVLFTGPPGTGKSSFIMALASHFSRNICFMQPCHKEMTDEVFKKALTKLPSNSILVLEDIDSLFTQNRCKLNNGVPLTFSGLLNGLDGLSSPCGQIICMTTNHVERLDPALVRAGRVDCRVELGYANEEQLNGMFLSFYPGSTTQAASFAKRLFHHSGKLSLAAVQNHFIKHRTSTADEASMLSDEELQEIQCTRQALTAVEDSSLDKKDETLFEHKDDNDETSAQQKGGATIKEFIEYLETMFKPAKQLKSLQCPAEEKKGENDDSSSKKLQEAEASRRLDALRDCLGSDVILSLLKIGLAK